MQHPAQVLVDEAHALKNNKTATYEAIDRVPTRLRCVGGWLGVPAGCMGGCPLPASRSLHPAACSRNARLLRVLGGLPAHASTQIRIICSLPPTLTAGGLPAGTA